MAFRGRLKEFLNRNLVAVVMVPVIVMLHWGWVKLQDNEKYVRQYDKKELPVLKGVQYLQKKLGFSKEQDSEK